MIVIIDNGSQYTHLIKRTARDMDFESQIINSRSSEKEFDDLLNSGAKRIVLSGGPSSVYTDPPNLSSYACKKVKEGLISLPLLGICYGHQMIGHCFGAQVAKGKSAEYGVCEITVQKQEAMFKDVVPKFRAWVSHFDEVKNLPSGFVGLARSDSCSLEAMCHVSRPIWSVQFHPEVWHTEHGEQILKNFFEL
ncbi:glutamine-hydrolyzing GMP synthase [Candidatus Micrarchaeota archaeon]|nr:glutamine-hydrolyzing GMP synthase [Candidatus Micrarchaeota archaeon]